MSWVDADALWSLVEEPSYAEACKALGMSIRRLDDLLYGATWAIARRADDNDIHPPLTRGIRLRKTVIPGSTAVLRVWYVLDDAKHCALLIHIDIWEPKSPEEEDLPW